jgi:hypothetical protein
MTKISPKIQNLSSKEKRQLLAKLLEERALKSTEEYPLSFNQWAMWFLYELSPKTTAYNVASSVRILSVLDVNSLKQAFQTIIDRHAPLRTTYTTRNNQTVQIVHAHLEVYFEKIDATRWTEEYLARQVEQAHRRPFSLENGPVMRVSLFSNAADNHILLISAHHIAIDGWSLGLLLDELKTLYTAYSNGQPRYPCSPWRKPTKILWFGKPKCFRARKERYTVIFGRNKSMKICRQWNYPLIILGQQCKLFRDVRWHLNLTRFLARR